MLLTIFTPAYNRADKLKHIYNSLKKQLNDKYEWLIVDDGSVDETEKIVSTFIDDLSLNVRYFKKENGGKHTAHNSAIELAAGRYFMCLDSDDYLAEGVLDKLLEMLESLEGEEGLVAYKCSQEGNLLSNIFPNEERILCFYELYSKYGCDGEFVLIYPTQLLKKNKFPVFSGERFITECVLYDRLHIPMKLFKEIVEVCEYQPDGLSNSLNDIMKNNPAGYCLYFMQRIDMQTRFMKRIITIGKYHCFCYLAAKQKSDYTGKHVVLVHLFKPLGKLFYVYYKKVRGF